jgi:hypothetical protein
VTTWNLSEISTSYIPPLIPRISSPVFITTSGNTATLFPPEILSKRFTDSSRKTLRKTTKIWYQVSIFGVTNFVIWKSSTHKSIATRTSHLVLWNFRLATTVRLHLCIPVMLPALTLFSLHLTLQSEGKTFLRNVGKCWSINAAWHVRRPES